MILADKIRSLAQADPHQDQRIANFWKNLESAPKYRVSLDALQAAKNVQLSRPSSILAAKDFCRTPYPRVWFEWCYNDCLTADGSRHQYDLHDCEPISVGIMFDMDGHGRVGALSLAWDNREIPGFVRLSPLTVMADFSYREAGDIQSWIDQFRRDEKIGDLHLHKQFAKHMQDDKEVEAMVRSEFCTTFVPSSYCDPMPYHEASKREQRALQDDWAGEVGLAEAILILLNCRNCVEQETVDLTKINQARIKRNKPPFVDHQLIKLHFRKRQQNAMAKRGMTKAEIRRHLVSGHYKLRKRRDGSTMPFWWSPYIRGTYGKPRVPEYAVHD